MSYLGLKEDDETMAVSRKRRPGKANNKHQEETSLQAINSTRRRQEPGPGVGHDGYKERARPGH